eukprot:CAMPEP_0173391874 /NCGR_PEP_ID=MMETSP1356-20130122/18632_1 /TAXON_ID=77927 ORGANISM="Hemiselmis virescens, Strain PCC157" /NCGR_SAMPLE_ID=MMETSP1356 /ASSEMBLY_ACC=CAM_ASM_000847 /LENGTH=450 /DNA_ID=CAMNT_0014349567 /DNA_START=12 /DNA_END=1361 /DNA_ORIENTATION=+
MSTDVPVAPIMTPTTPLLRRQQSASQKQRRTRSMQGNGATDESSWRMFGKEEGKTELDWRSEMTQSFMWMASFAFVGIALAVLENEILWYTKVGTEMEETVWTHALKIGVVGSTVASFVFLIYYYDAQIKVLRASGVEFSPGFSLISLNESRLLRWFLLDLVVLIPQPMPFIHFTFEIMDVQGKAPTIYTADCIFMCMMFLRLVYLPRFVAQVSLLRQELAYRMARFYNVDINTWTVMRSLLSSDLNTLLFFIVVTVFALSYTLLLVERPHIQGTADVGHGLDEFETSLWVTIITLTTVGLGDVVPATKLGRVAIVINACFAIAFYALIVNIIVANVQLTPQEQRIVEFVKRSGLQKTNKQSAARVIQTCWRQYRINVTALRKGRVNTMVRVHPAIRNVLMQFRYDNRKVKELHMDRDTQMARSVFDLQATASGMERQLQEIHGVVVGRG